MRNILLSDITMKQPVGSGGYDLSFKEKLELAKMLDRLGVHVIETSPIVNHRTDSLLIKSLASAISTSTLAAPLSLTDPESVKITWDALKEAKSPRLQVAAPVSTVQMEYISHLKAQDVIDNVSLRIKEAKSLCSEVEFLAEDAGRSDRDFLQQVIDAAVEAGADIVTLCDTAGSLLPDEVGRSVKAWRGQVPENVRLGALISNDISLAEACAISAVLAGADEVKTTSCGSFTVSLGSLVNILKVRGADHGLNCTVRDTELKRTVKQISRMCEAETGSGTNIEGAAQDDYGSVLTIHDDITSVMDAVNALGYDLGEEDSINVYEAFQRIASKKESVGTKELDAIVASAALQVPPTFKVNNYVINSGNVITATSHIVLEKDGSLMDGLAVGDGPIDASFLAIEQIVGHRFELDDFQIQAVTEGREAMGETVVRLRSAAGKVYSGRGISTDIIGSSINAYVSAVNKIVYEEGEI